MRGRLTYWKAASRAPETSPLSGVLGTRTAGADSWWAQSAAVDLSKETVVKRCRHISCGLPASAVVRKRSSPGAEKWKKCGNGVHGEWEGHLWDELILHARRPDQATLLNVACQW
ncbi:hypothetical protein NDU88_004159 [Pleurodeles waltl]|uniref:Uncharacterized protein n=1 Tax=Pleurodeles waltl TaxID=8319 RepID=A0AAV7W712_PLEWA|nr:hypothetical protein NDU88_004159 [Pleurodeles waltl]